jgi:predicted LPLAT superfamily acyltransferase
MFANRLQSLAVDYPLQWFNFYPFWKDGAKK